MNLQQLMTKLAYLECPTGIADIAWELVDAGVPLSTWLKLKG